jgi:lysine 2,3-aminomutase
VLLKGVNDDAKVMMKLMHELLKARVRPYYLYMADQVAGGEHFRTTVQKGLEIMQALRGWTSGLAVPQFVIDSPGGGGKVPLLPEYLESMTDDEVIFRNYEGKRFVYKQPHTVPAAPTEIERAAEVGVVPIGRKKSATPRRTKRRRAAGE